MFNKVWAKEISINNEDKDRRRFHISSHPAILDGFISAYRKQLKEKITNNEETEMAENDKKKNWISVKVSHHACLAEREKHLFMKMPNDSQYSGYTYNIFKSKVKESRQLVDVESDGHELCYELLLLDGEMIFKALYDGQDLQNNHSNSDMSLMNRLAYWCNGDKEQMLRIFATSGLYRPNKSADYYECTVVKAIKDTTNRFQQNTQNSYKPKSPVNNSGNGKR